MWYCRTKDPFIKCCIHLASVTKYNDIISTYLQKSVLASFRPGKCFTIYNHETQDILLIEQMAIYATFELKNKIREHSRSYDKVMTNEKLFRQFWYTNKRWVLFWNVNSGEHSGLKCLIKRITIKFCWYWCYCIDVDIFRTYSYI